ncbi:MAG TPA: hypothetical protein VLC09_14015 [Polyangiaceae bacterium]|nr:hypothetical protein [Polyangiaceae bacterium]
MTEHDDEDFVNRALAGLERFEPSAELMRRVAELPLRHPRAVGPRWPFQSWWAPLLAGAFAALLGVSAGLTSLDPLGAQTTESEASASSTSSATSATSAAENEWQELASIAWGDDTLQTAFDSP